jgi:uncharacterized protein (DUF1778 family)
MPTAKPRITVTLTEHQYDVLTRLASARGASRSSIMVDLLDASLPVLERAFKLLEALEAARKGDYLEDFVASMDKAEATLAPLLASALEAMEEQMELPMSAKPPPSNTGVTSPTARPPKAPAKGAKAPSHAASSKGKRS